MLLHVCCTQTSVIDVIDYLDWTKKLSAGFSNDAQVIAHVAPTQNRRAADSRHSICWVSAVPRCVEYC